MSPDVSLLRALIFCETRALDARATGRLFAARAWSALGAAVRLAMRRRLRPAERRELTFVGGGRAWIVSVTRGEVLVRTFCFPQAPSAPEFEGDAA